MRVLIPTPCRMVHIDLAGEPGPLAVDEPYRAVTVFYWLEGVAVGHAIFHARELPLSAVQHQAAAREAILPGLADHLLEAATFDPREGLRHLATGDPLEQFRDLRRRKRAARTPISSVVICTHERPESLGRCLRSVQSVQSNGVDVLVVDNAPATDATLRVVQEFPGVRYVSEPRRGLSYARNCGVANSHGELIAFTDDDVVVDANWLEELARPFDDPDVMSATGLVIPAELETREQALFEYWMTFHRGYARQVFDRAWFEKSGGKAVPVWDLGAGANMAIRREAFRAVGLFDECLGAGRAGCSEDSEFWYRLLASGRTCVYNPAASVRHFHRSGSRGLAHQMRMYSRGHSAALLLQFARYRHPGNLRRLILSIPRLHVRMIFGSIFLPQERSLWLASARGAIEAPFYLLAGPR